MLALKDLASKLPKIVFRVEQFCAPDFLSLIQVVIRDQAGEKTKLLRIELVAEVPDLVVLELKPTTLRKVVVL